MSADEEAQEAERLKCMTARPAQEPESFDAPEPAHDDIVCVQVRIDGVPILDYYDIPYASVNRSVVASVLLKPLTAEQVRADIKAMLDAIEARPIRRW